jgi:hypothetical protein
MGYFAIPAAGLGFFFSAWLLMMFWGIVAPDLNVPTVSYPTAMLITIGFWLVISPLIAASVRKTKGH